jgi:flagellar basal-body rod modification protein FlgD
MDPVVATNAVPQGQAQTVKAPDEGKGSATMIASDFETFLKLLTTQLENQDPLNPMESSEFAVQLATFSGVEQQVQTNALLKSMAEAADAQGLSEMASWVGMEARSPALKYFDGTALTLTPPALATADRAMMVVSDETGDIVGRFDIPNDGAPYTWLGTGSGGVPLRPGRYSFAVEGYQGQTLVATRPLEGYGIVAEVQSGADGPVLVMADGSRVLAADVTAVRAVNP